MLTSAKRDVMTTALSQAKGWLQDALQIQPVVGSLSLSQGWSCGSSFGYACCQDQFQGPRSYASADVVLLVTARPTSGSTIAWCVGWGGGEGGSAAVDLRRPGRPYSPRRALSCQYDQSTRPLLGQINFSPAFLDTSSRARTKLVGIAIHESACTG